MLADLSVQMQGGAAVIDDGTVTHTFADPQAARLFLHTWRALRLQNPVVEFTLNDDATIATWGGPAAQPTPAQVAAVVAALRAAETQQATDAAALRARVLTLAQSAVGVQLDQLTAAQVRAMISLLLYKQGAIDKSGAVRPLAEWN